MRVLGFCQDDGACTDIRLKQPLSKIRSLGLADVDLVTDSSDTIPARVKKADVVVLGRSFSQGIVRIIEQIHEWGGKVVFDLDDNFFDISPYSPHYKDLGIMPINIDHADGRSVKMWADGEGGFSVPNNRRVRKDFVDVIRSVDCVTVTTEPLRKEYSRFNDNVRIVPNAIDFSLWEKPPIKWERDEVRLVYTGASNHQEDFFFIKDVLAALQRKHPKLKLVFLGTDWRVVKNGLDYSRVESHRWVPIPAYPYLMRSLCGDIGIAPISKTGFNDCRSALKWKEYSALKMATVATDFGPYRRAIVDGETGCLADTPESWERALSFLIENKEIRENMAARAYEEVKTKYNLDYVVDEWVNIFAGATT